jgi:hypothetical protein
MSKASDGTVRAKWVMFHPQPQGRKKTRIWHVTTLPMDRGDPCHDLGEIRWHAPWRKYAYFPDASTLYEPDCLEDLASFCRGQTKKHYEALKTAKLRAIEDASGYFGIR